MSFRIFSHGPARFRFHFDKTFSDPGALIKETDWIGKLADKAKVPLGTEDSGVKKGIDKEASMVVSSLLRTLISDYCVSDARLTISHTNPGVLGGIIGSRFLGPETYDFEDFQLATMDFADLLKRMALNNWGYVRGLVQTMSDYSSHCETYGRMPCGMSLLVQVTDR
jgi:hypothetical protein